MGFEAVRPGGEGFGGAEVDDESADDDTCEPLSFGEGDGGEGVSEDCTVGEEGWPGLLELHPIAVGRIVFVVVVGHDSDGVSMELAGGEWKSRGTAQQTRRRREESREDNEIQES